MNLPLFLNRKSLLNRKYETVASWGVLIVSKGQVKFLFKQPLEAF